MRAGTETRRASRDSWAIRSGTCSRARRVVRATLAPGRSWIRIAADMLHVMRAAGVVIAFSAVVVSACGGNVATASHGDASSDGFSTTDGGVDVIALDTAPSSDTKPSSDVVMG